MMKIISKFAAAQFRLNSIVLYQRGGAIQDITVDRNINKPSR